MWVPLPKQQIVDTTSTATVPRVVLIELHTAKTYFHGRQNSAIIREIDGH